MPVSLDGVAQAVGLRTLARLRADGHVPVVVASKYGTVTYAVSTVPAGWDWKADEQAASAGKSSAGGAVSAYKFSGGGQLATSRDANATDHQAVASSHHLLVIDVTARGGGFLQSGSGVELTVLAEMVYLGR